MAARKPAAKPVADKAAPKATMAQSGPSTETRKAAGKRGAPVAQASRNVVEPAPAKPTIAMDAPAAVVDKLITSIKTRGQKYDADVHSAAMACLFHADKHGDITLMNRLLVALPKSSRRNALAQWAVRFGKFQPNEDKATLQTVPLAFDKSKVTLFDDAQAQPFWDVKNVREGTTTWEFGNFIGGVKKVLAKAMTGTGADALKAKAMLDAIVAAEEALAVPAKNEAGEAWVPGKSPDRRGLVGSPVPVSASANNGRPVH